MIFLRVFLDMTRSGYFFWIKGSFSALTMLGLSEKKTLLLLVSRLYSIKSLPCTKIIKLYVLRSGYKLKVTQK